jgi:hypothetical protein
MREEWCGECVTEREREREKVFDATWMKQDPFTSPEPQHGSWRRRRRTYSITSLQSSAHAPLLLPFDSGFKRKLQPKARQFFSISFSLALFFLGWALLLVGCLGTPSYTLTSLSLSSQGFPDQFEMGETRSRQPARVSSCPGIRNNRI